MKRILKTYACRALVAAGTVATAVNTFAADGDITDPTATVKSAVVSNLNWGLTILGVLVGIGTIVYIVKKARKGL